MDPRDRSSAEGRRIILDEDLFLLPGALEVLLDRSLDFFEEDEDFFRLRSSSEVVASSVEVLCVWSSVSEGPEDEEDEERERSEPEEVCAVTPYRLGFFGGFEDGLEGGPRENGV